MTMTIRFATMTGDKRDKRDKRDTRERFKGLEEFEEFATMTGEGEIKEIKEMGITMDDTPAATMNDDERDKRDKRDKRDTREGLGLEEEVGFLLTASNQVVGGDANVWMFGVGNVDETVNVVGEGLIRITCKEGPHKSRFAKLQLGAGETNREHGIEAILDFGERTKPRVIKGGAPLSPAKKAVKFNELNFLNNLFDGHKQVVH